MTLLFSNESDDDNLIHERNLLQIYLRRVNTNCIMLISVLLSVSVPMSEKKYEKHDVKNMIDASVVMHNYKWHDR